MTVAEETCRRGHPRTPKSTYFFPGLNKRTCVVCRRTANQRYQASPRGREKHADTDWRYAHSTKGMLRTLRFETRKAGA